MMAILSEIGNHFCNRMLKIGLFISTNILAKAWDNVDKLFPPSHHHISSTWKMRPCPQNRQRKGVKPIPQPVAYLQSQRSRRVEAGNGQCQRDSGAQLSLWGKVGVLPLHRKDAAKRTGWGLQRLSPRGLVLDTPMGNVRAMTETTGRKEHGPWTRTWAPGRASLGH